MTFVDMPDDVRAFLGGLGAVLSDLPASPSVAERRLALERLASQFGPASPRAQIEDRVIEHRKGRTPVRIYRPAIETKSPGILVNIHGGGWALGGFEAYERVCHAYCQASGAIVVDVAYRLAPEHKFPAAFDDCVAAIEWAHKHASELGADPSRLVVTGDSAGGNLAACATRAVRVPVALQILVYPVVHVGRGLRLQSREEFGAGDRFLTLQDILRAEQEYLSSPHVAKDPRVNPLRGDLRRAPPTLLIAAQFDPLRDEALLLHRKLVDAGVKSRYWEAPGMIHGFVLFAGAIAAGADMIRLIGDQVRGAGAADHLGRSGPL